MPELPEAETIARELHGRIAGRTLRRIRVHREELVEPLTPTAFRRALKGRRVDTVIRRGKWITALLDDGHRWVTQLRMTGRFSWGPPSPLRADRHLSASFLVGASTDEGVVRFYDTRRFGRMWVLGSEAWAQLDARLGIEPLSDEFTCEALGQRLAGSRAPIRNVLLDQNRIAGIGNIYANEACYLAEVDPRRAAGSLDDSQILRLHAAILSVLREAIARRGTSFNDYRDLAGDEGEFQDRLNVYGRAGETCQRCGSEIARTALAGRSAFYCGSCQR